VFGVQLSGLYDNENILNTVEVEIITRAQNSILNSFIIKAFETFMNTLGLLLMVSHIIR
jgi:hypothetical protein